MSQLLNCRRCGHSWQYGGAVLGANAGTVFCPGCGVSGDFEIVAAMSSGSANPFADEAAISRPGQTPGASGLASSNPYAFSSPAALGELLANDSSRDRTGLPWEQRSAGVAVYWETLCLVLFRARTAFSVMKRDAGLGKSISFAIAGGCCGMVGVLAREYIKDAVRQQTWEVDSSDLANGLFTFLAGVFIGPLCKVFLYGGASHFLLWLFRGTRQPFATTAILALFIHGASDPLRGILGDLLAAVVEIYLWTVALQRAHETSRSKALAAVLIPVILVLGLILVAVIWVIQKFVS